MMYGFGNGTFFGMALGMLLVILPIFLAGMAVGYLIGRSRQSGNCRNSTEEQ